MESFKKISLWFPTLIYEDILTEFESTNQYLESKAYNIQSLVPETKTSWSCDTYNTLLQYNVNQDSDSLVQRLISTCKEKVIDFASEYGIEKTINDLDCDDFWFNISKPNSFQEYHIHPRSDFSLVYYVKAKKDSGNIIFQSNNALSDMFPLKTNKLTYASYQTCFYRPRESMILIFRSGLAHMVEKNLSGEDRISIAMNFRFKES